MSTRLIALTARRAALQAQCARDRESAALSYGDIEQGAAKADRIVAGVRRLAPVLIVGSVVALLAIGPARALALLRRGLAVGLFTREARRLLR